MSKDPAAFIVRKHESLLYSFLPSPVPESYIFYVPNKFIIRPFICIGKKYLPNNSSKIEFSESPRELTRIQEGINQGSIDIIVATILSEEQIKKLRDECREYAHHCESIENLIKEVSKTLKPF